MAMASVTSAARAEIARARAKGLAGASATSSPRASVTDSAAAALAAAGRIQPFLLFCGCIQL